MKLLFDANLSPKLVALLTDLFPGLTHVFATGLAQFTPDVIIWDYARDNDFTIVTADADFIQLVEQRGAPPKVIRIEKCDFRTAELETCCDVTQFGLRSSLGPSKHCLSCAQHGPNSLCQQSDNAGFAGENACATSTDQQFAQPGGASFSLPGLWTQAAKLVS